MLFNTATQLATGDDAYNILGIPVSDSVNEVHLYLNTLPS